MEFWPIGNYDICTMMEYLLEDNQKEPKEKDSWTF